MAPRTQRKPRVFWKSEEVEKVAEAAVKAAMEDKDHIWAFVAKGQEVLSQDRRRSITGRAGVNDQMMEAFCKARQEVLEAGVPIVVNIEKGPTEVLVERPREELLNSLTTEELVRVLAKRAAPILEMIPALMQKSTDQSASRGASAPMNGGPRAVQPQTATARVPRVLVFGFLPRQEPDILEKAKGFNLDIVFQNKETAQVDPPPSCQWCIFLNKISHPASNKLKKHFGGFGTGRVIMVDGITQAIKALADINSQVGSGTR